jgi:hypothetical protein
MGGLGSGRWRGHCKAQTVELCFVLDAAILASIAPAGRGRGIAEMGACNSPRVLEVPWEVAHTTGPELRLWLNGDRQPPGVVALSVRGMRYGGVCWYLHCPECGRRVRRLHVPLAGRHFLACRQCHGLVYESSQVHRTVGELIHHHNWAGLHEHLAVLRAQIEQPIGEKMPRPAGARAAREPRPGATNTHW